MAPEQARWNFDFLWNFNYGTIPKTRILIYYEKKMYYYTKNYETSIIVVFCHVLLRKLRKYKNKLKEFWQSVYDYDYPNGDGDLMVFVVNPYFSHPI